MKEAILFTSIGENRVKCELCAHNCVISPGNVGICGVRKNIDGKLFTYNFGNLIAQNIDPIEKKPLYHFLPGSSSFSIALPGCNFRCSFCQNWEISQINCTDNSFKSKQLYSPDQVVKNAIDSGCKSISFTYTEPTIYFEFALETSIIAKSYGLKTILVSNGYFTSKALELILPYLDACNIDLKAFTEKFYEINCRARLEPVKDTIKLLSSNKVWTELTTLLIPGENDSVHELNNITEFIAGIDKEMPWHVSRFFPRYKMNKQKPTSIESIENAVEAGKNAGLRYVYKGNISEEIPTSCPSCGEILIVRRGYSIIKNQTVNGGCSRCKSVIKGVWQ